jgi:archaellum component FlaD/FlaE
MSVQTEESRTVRLPNDRKATVEKQRSRGDYHARLRVSLDTEFVLGVDEERNAELLASYDERGNLATVPIPDWIEFVLDEIGLEEVDL